MIEGKDSKIFPKLTICDVKTKGLDQDHIYSVQCVLPFNIFNERMYAFLWLWIFIIIISFTLIDLISWINRAFLFGTFYRFNFIKKRLRIFNNVKNNDKLIKLFTKYYIGIDGVFILRLLEYNSSVTLVYDLINKMWLDFLIDINQ
jgi:innexin